jgi:Mn-dependent DtxR family transcriptional regulator
MSDEIRRRRENRRRYLEHLYRCSEEQSTEYQDGYEVAEALGIGRQDAERIVRYLEDHGFVTKTGRTGLVLRVTAQGIDHVEAEAMEEDEG